MPLEPPPQRRDDQVHHDADEPEAAAAEGDAASADAAAADVLDLGRIELGVGIEGHAPVMPRPEPIQSRRQCRSRTGAQLQAQPIASSAAAWLDAGASCTGISVRSPDDVDDAGDDAVRRRHDELEAVPRRA